MGGMGKKKKKEEEVVPFRVGDKERKAINRMAVSQSHKSKAFKAKEALKAKKQRNAARWKKGKKEGKRKQHAKKVCKTKRLNRILLQKYIYFFNQNKDETKRNR